MNRIMKMIGSSIALAALSACGGGGDSGSRSPVPAPVTKTYTATDVLGVASLGATATLITGVSSERVFGFLGAVLQGFAGDSGGSRVVAPFGKCDTGTATATVSKSAARVGLAAGDQVTMTFSQCKTPGLDSILDGVAKVTAHVAIATPSNTDFAVSYEAVLTAFSIKSGATTFQYDGVVDAAASAVGGNAFSDGFVVPAGQTYTDAMSGTVSTKLVYSAGASFIAIDTAIPNGASRKLNGSVSITANSLPAAALVISTPIALSGTTSSGRFVATAGLFNINSTGQSPATSVMFSPTAANVSGDSDDNGTLDLSFSSTWAAMTTL